MLLDLQEEFCPLDAHIELRHLSYTVAAAHYRRFRWAAEAHGVKQSILSRYILQLEMRLGVVLFERTSEGFRLTTAGTEILRTSRHLIETVDYMAATTKAPWASQ